METLILFRKLSNKPSKPSKVPIWGQLHSMKMLQNTICSIITFRVYIVWWKGEKYPGHWSKELNPATIPGSSQVHMILTYLSWWKLIKKKKKRRNKKNNPEVSEICFPIPINKSVQSIKQKKAGEFMGIFTYGSRSP